MLKLVDSHAHLDDSRFESDVDGVVDRARRAGVALQIIPATDQTSWLPIQTICSKHKGLFPAYGLHPTFLSHHQPSHLDALSQWLESGHAVAVGEIGLDFHVPDLDLAVQRDYFQKQLRLAREFNLPVIVHARRAFEEVTHELRRVGGLRGVVHSFSGSEVQAHNLFKLGFHVGIGGPVTYERAQRLRRIVASMPVEFLLLESDAPDQPTSSHRGQRNEPAYIADIARCIARLRHMDIQDLATATTANACQLFGLPNNSALIGNLSG